MHFPHMPGHANSLHLCHNARRRVKFGSPDERQGIMRRLQHEHDVTLVGRPRRRKVVAVQAPLVEDDGVEGIDVLQQGTVVGHVATAAGLPATEALEGLLAAAEAVRRAAVSLIPVQYILDHVRSTCRLGIATLSAQGFIEVDVFERDERYDDENGADQEQAPEAPRLTAQRSRPQSSFRHFWILRAIWVTHVGAGD